MYYICFPEQFVCFDDVFDLLKCACEVLLLSAEVLTGCSWWQALDHVIAESRQHGIRLLLSLVNNLQAYGGKTQYVKWAWQDGVGLSSSNDSFFYDPSIRIYFKNYIKVHSISINEFVQYAS